MTADRTALAAPRRPRSRRLAAGSARRRRCLPSSPSLFLVWEYAVRLFGMKEYLLPPPSKVWTEFLKRWDTVLQGAWVTTQEILGGYLLAVVVSIPLALAVARSRFVEETVYPVVVFLQIIPKIAIAPLFIIWLGFGFTPKLLIVFLLCFFPIVVASVAGFKSVDPEIMDFARTTGASGWTHVLQDPAAAGAAGHLHRAEGRAPRSPPPRRWWRSSSPPTGGSATCCSSTTATWRRRWCSPSSCSEPDRPCRLLRRRADRAAGDPLARLAAPAG